MEDLIALGVPTVDGRARGAVAMSAASALDPTGRDDRALVRFGTLSAARPTQEAAVRIGIPRESRPGETLVAATAKTAAQLVALGYEVVVEAGAGAAADQPDATYADAGVRVGTGDDVWTSDVVVKVNAPTDARDRSAAQRRHRGRAARAGP